MRWFAGASNPTTSLHWIPVLKSELVDGYPCGYICYRSRRCSDQFLSSISVQRNPPPPPPPPAPSTSSIALNCAQSPRGILLNCAKFLMNMNTPKKPTTTFSPAKSTLSIKSTLSQKPTTTFSPPLPPSSSSATKPLRKIPDDYGLPLVGPFRDRFDYFYTQGHDDFFKSRIHRHSSTVFRVNMPPDPFLAPDPRVVALLDAASFPVLFDNSLVQKKDLFTGTFMPSVDLTGGFCTLSYLDTSEPNHAPLKKLLFFLLASKRDFVIPLVPLHLRRPLPPPRERENEQKGKVDFGAANDQASFNFLARALLGKDPQIKESFVV